MHSVLVRNYRYKYSREGIIPGTWYIDFLLDPCSVSLGRSEIGPPDYDIVTVSARIVMKQYQDGKVEYYGSTEERRVFRLGKDREITDRDHARYVERCRAITSLGTLVIPRYRALIIDGTEYNNRYVRDHLNDLRVFLDRIRTDAPLEEIDA